MKKMLSVVLILTLCFGLGTIFTGCGEKNEDLYSDVDLATYITLPDYDAYNMKKPTPAKVTKAQIEEAIENDLANYGQTTEITEGTVKKGDTVKIAYAGTLEDGSTVEGMSSAEYTLTLGEGGMIEGFEEGIYGATIGEPIKVKTQFPDPYPNNKDLSGKDAEFVITVLCKEETVLPELTDSFIQYAYEDYYKTVEEYKSDVKAYYEKENAEKAVQEAKDALFTRLLEESEFIELPEDRLTVEAANYIDMQKHYADFYSLSWSMYLQTYLGMDEEQLAEAATEYAEETVKHELLIYAIAQKEGLSVSEEEYDTAKQDLLTEMNVSLDNFTEMMGMDLDSYADKYSLKRDVLKEKDIDLIYERLVEDK